MIDFGARHSVYEDPALFKRVKQILDPYPYVILLLPSADLNESIQILNERNEYISDGTLNINEHFVKHNSNYELAKFTIYTKDKTPDETCNEILALF